MNHLHDADTSHEWERREQEAERRQDWRAQGLDKEKHMPTQTTAATYHQRRSNLLSMHATAERYATDPRRKGDHARQVAALATREAELQRDFPDLWAEYTAQRDADRRYRANMQQQRNEAAAELAQAAAPERAIAEQLAADRQANAEAADTFRQQQAAGRRATRLAARLAATPDPDPHAEPGRQAEAAIRAAAPAPAAHAHLVKCSALDCCSLATDRVTSAEPLCGFHAAQAATLPDWRRCDRCGARFRIAANAAMVPHLAIGNTPCPAAPHEHAPAADADLPEFTHRRAAAEPRIRLVDAPPKPAAAPSKPTPAAKPNRTVTSPAAAQSAAPQPADELRAAISALLKRYPSGQIIDATWEVSAAEFRARQDAGRNGSQARQEARA